jgi:16S rRNA processing protein RimM
VTEELLAVGRITRAHGVQGQVAVQSLTEVSERFAPGSVLLTEDDRRLTVRSTRPHGHRLLVTFDEIDDRTEAESLRGELLLIPATDTPRIEEPDRFWVHQVVGLDVVSEDGRSLGRISEVHSNPANDLWVTDQGALIPAVREVVRAVDLHRGRVTVVELPGLLED